MKNGMTATAPKAFPPLMVPVSDFKSQGAVAARVRHVRTRPFSTREQWLILMVLDREIKRGVSPLEDCFPALEDIRTLQRLSRRFHAWVGYPLGGSDAS